MTKEEAILIAKKFRMKLEKHKIPVRQMLLYGSVARGEANEESDIDIAVICTPFNESRLQENIEISKQRWNLDLRIEPICLHPEDLDDPYFDLAKNIQKEGIVV